MDPDRSRILKVSGEDSREAEGEGLFRFREFALSAIDGDLEPRTLPFRTAKNEGDAPGVGPVEGVGIAGPDPCNFSSAFILWEIPDPRLIFFAIGVVGRWLIRFRYAAEADTDRVGSLAGGLSN